MAKIKYLGLGELGFSYEYNRVAHFAWNVVKGDFLSNFQPLYWHILFHKSYANFL